MAERWLGFQRERERARDMAAYEYIEDIREREIECKLFSNNNQQQIVCARTRFDANREKEKKKREREKNSKNGCDSRAQLK